MARFKGVFRGPSDGPQLPTPAPEIVDPGPWDIVAVPDQMGLLGFASRGERRMVVPMAETPQGSAVRLHELAHVKWSPPTVPVIDGLDPLFLLGVEDFRVNVLLQENIVDFVQETAPALRLENDEAMFDFLKPMVEEKKFREIASFMIAGYGLGYESQYVEALSTLNDDDMLSDDDLQVLYKALNAAGSVVLNEVNDFNSTVIAAKAMQATLDKHFARQAIKESVEDDEVGSMVEDGLETMEQYLDRMELNELFQALRQKDMRAMESAVRTMMGGEGEESSDNQWGEMTLDKRPLVMKLRNRKIARQKRSDRYGSVPRHIHRWYTDQKIFSRNYREFGGAVLLDQSGSMSLSADDIKALVLASPAVLVGGYAGERDRGTLRIMAEHGSRVADEFLTFDFGGNVIDGPALRWLAKQTFPRIWVCDGQVTGIGDSMSANLHREAVALCRRNHILRVPNVQSAIAIFERLR